jgi:phage-related minor tail protein
MESIEVLLRTLLSFLLQLVSLIVGFVISALTLFLDFFRALVGLVS